MSLVVQIFSDYASPFCYLADEVAARAAGSVGAELVRRAWFQDGASRAGEDRPAMEAWWNETVYPVAARLGVRIRRPSRLPQTRAAHLAACWARSRGRFEDYHRRLFAAYFREDLDIGDLEVLKALARAAGLDDVELGRGLASPELAEEMEEDFLIARTYGVAAPPAIVIAGQLIYGVPEEAALARAMGNAARGEPPGLPRRLEAGKAPVQLPIGIGGRPLR